MELSLSFSETFLYRKPRDIPFHLPHKKLVEKIEYVEPEPEPLVNVFN